MDEREQQRKIRHRLAVLHHAAEVAGNVSATCRYCTGPPPTMHSVLVPCAPLRASMRPPRR